MTALKRFHEAVSKFHVPRYDEITIVRGKDGSVYLPVTDHLYYGRDAHERLFINIPLRRRVVWMPAPSGDKCLSGTGQGSVVREAPNLAIVINQRFHNEVDFFDMTDIPSTAHVDDKIDLVERLLSGKTIYLPVTRHLSVFRRVSPEECKVEISMVRESP